MFDFGDYYNKEVQINKMKLRTAWEKFYTPMQMAQAKFRIKVNSRIKKGKFPTNN